MQCILTSSYVNEVLSSGFVHLDVSVADVMLVPPESHITMRNVLKQHQGLAIPPSLW